MSDFFTSVSSTFNMKKISKVTDPVLVNRTEYDYLILTERPLKDKELENAKKFLEHNLKGTYKLVSVLPYHEKAEDIKQVINTYKKDSIDLHQYIRQGSKVITMGRAIYSVVRSDILDVQSFHDYIFNKTYFFSKEYNCTIYPCHSFDIIVGQKTFERHFTIKQFDYIRKEPELNRKRVSGKIINSKEEFLELLKNNESATKVAVDTETTGLHHVRDQISTLQLAFNENVGYFMDWRHVDVPALSEFLKNKFQIYANGKFDIKILVHKGVSRESLHIDFDVNSSGHILNEMRSNSLKVNAWLYTVYGGYEEELKEYMVKHKIKKFKDVPLPILEKYSWMDAVVTFQVYVAHDKQISAIDQAYPMTNGWSLRRYYEELMIPATNMFIDIEYFGLPIDERVLEESSKELDRQLKEIKEKFYTYIGMNESEVSITSTKALGKLFKERGLPNLGEDYISAEGYYLTNDDCLEAWAKLGYKEAELLSEFRKVEIIQKTFVGRKSENSGIWQYIVDGKIHSSFWIMLAESGRGRSSDPNLQNLVAHGPLAKLSKSFYRPPEGFNFMSGDFSGLQLRIACMLSGDKNMREAFTKLGGDLHSKTAVSSLLAGKITLEDFLKRKKDPEWVDWVKSWRLKAKGCNFGLLFGKVALSVMVQDIMPNWTEEECNEFIKDNKLKVLELNGSKNIYYTVADYVRRKFFEEYEGLQKWHEDTRNFAMKNGYVRSIHGLFRRLPELLYKDDQNRKRTANLLNIALNTSVQSVEMVIVMRAMLAYTRIAKEKGMSSRFFAYIHDAVEKFVPDDELVLSRDLFIQEATRDYPEYEGIPLEVEGNIADPRKGQVWDMGNDWFTI